MTTDGTIKQITFILNKLDQANAPGTEFLQKPPSLKVFLKIIGEKHERMR